MANTEPTQPRGDFARFALQLLLRIVGVITLCALPAVFMPLSWMDDAHRTLGLGPLPEGPVVEYLARSASGLYASLGVLTLLLARDVERFAPLVTWWGVMFIVMGAVLIWIDLKAGLPAYWIWGEGPLLIPVGLAALWLQRRVRERADRAAAHEKF